MTDSTILWSRYQKGVDNHNKNSLYSKTESCYNMVEGRQWADLESGDEKFSNHDFITGLVGFKVANVAMNDLTVNFSSTNKGENQLAFREACEKLNQHVADKWEQGKMDTKKWDMAYSSCVGGDSYLFTYNSNLDSQIIDRTNIYLSNEQEKDMQKQRRVIIYERRSVDDVKADAKKNKVKAEDIDLIVADDDTTNLPEASRQEVEDNMCSCLLQIEKKDDGIYFTRSTKTVIYQTETKVEGLKRIPVDPLIWYPKRGSARGIGEVERLINNQINTNKILAIRQQNNKMTGYPRPVYSQDAIANPDDITKVATAIKIKGLTVQKIRDYFDYIAPSSMSPDGKVLQDELIFTSRDLANAGDNATGNISPEKASGAAIIAVRDQQAIASTRSTAFFKQWVEDVGRTWLDIITAYNPNGLEFSTERDGETVTETIDASILQELTVSVRVDVSPTNPFSKYAREQALENALEKQYITFEEYVEMLDDDSTAPKGKFEDILEKRKAVAEEQNQEAMMHEEAKRMAAEKLASEGGMLNVMPEM